MKKLLDYCYYRASAFYKEWGENIYCLMGSRVAYGSLIFLIVAGIIIFYSLLFKKFPHAIFFLVAGVVCVIICGHFADEEKFELLVKKYKNEKHKKLKGCLVVAYWLLSWIMFLFVCVFMNHVIKCV